MYQNLSKIYDPFGWGEFSQELFAKLRPLMQKWGIRTHCDFACGTGGFVSNVSRLGIKSHGIDISPEMVKLAKKNYPALNFQVADITSYTTPEPVDLITCNFDTVNHLLKFSEWRQLFRQAHANLSDGGRFVFDMNTLEALESSDDTDYVEIDGNCLIHKTYYKGGKLHFDLEWFIRNRRGSYDRYTELVTEVSFPFEKVEAALEQAGFKRVSLLNSRIDKKNQSRLYVLAEK